MESDLPLMEDDSLIQHFPDPNQTPSKYSSHFKLPPSHTKSLKDGVHLEKPSSSSSEASNNKENINSKNVELPKLGMGPMQMKRKKQGGGYNLRKSLAWDRAFFTDEGILDPLELTLITGINANTCGGGLHTISEEGNNSFSSDTRCTKGPKDKETSEEVPLDDKSRTLKVKGEKTGCSVGNHDSSPHRKVTHKFLSNDRTNKVGSKVGVSEPLAASSLKRPANSNTLKTANKESKLPKLPMSKPGSFYSATTKGSTTASQLRHNLIPKPTINPQKNVALKSSVKNVHGFQSKAKTGSGSLRLPIKEPAKKTVRNLTNSSHKATSSTKSRLVHVDRGNSGSEVVPDRSHLCEIEERSAPLAAKNQGQHTATSLNNSLPEAARLNSSGPCHIERASNGLNTSDRLHPSDTQEHPATLASSHHMNLSNTQPARPSGLRLPSPSLRFFDQRTTLESGSLQQKNIQLHNTNMGSNRKISELRPPAVPARTPMKSTDITENVCSIPTSSGRCLPARTQLIPLPNYLGSTTNGVLDSDIYRNLEREIMQREDIKMQYECRGSEVNKVIEQEKRTIGHDENMKVEKFAWNKEMSTSGQSIQHQEQNIFTAVDGNTNFIQDLAQTSSEQADTEKSDAPKVNPESHSNVDSLKAQDQVGKVFASQRDEIGKSEDDVRSTKWVGPGSENCSVVLQHIKIGQENDVAKAQLQDSPVRDAVPIVLPDNQYAEGFHIESSTSIKVNVQLQDSGTANQSAKCFETRIPCVSALLNSQFCSEGQSVDCIMPAERSSLEEGPCDNVIEINDDFFQEKGNYSKAILMEVLDRKQDAVDVALTDDHNHYSLSCLRPEVELISGTASVSQTESLLQVAQCANTYPLSLEKEGLSLAAATIEAEFKTDEENQKSQETGITIRSLSRKSIVAEESQHSCGNMEANATIQGSETINNFSKTHLEDAQMQLGSSLTPVLHNHSIQDVDHSDIFEEQPEFSDNGMKLEKDLSSNHQLLPTTDSVLQECVGKGVMNVVDQSDVYECDRKPSNTIVHSPPAGQAVGLHCNNNGQLCVAYGTSGSTGMDSISEHDENYSDRQYTYNTECSDLVLLSELKSSGNDEMEGVNTCVEYCSAGEESCSFLRKVADSMLEEEPTLFGEFGQVAADNKQVYMNESLSPEKNANLDKAKNFVDIVSHGCDCDLQNSNAGALSPTVQGNASDLYGEDQPNQSQGFDGIMPLQGTYDYVINERSGYGLESCGQENYVAKVVDDRYKSSHMEDDAGCSADSPCNETKGRISITSRESLKDEAGNGGNTDMRELEGTVTMLDTSSIPFQNMDTEQGNDDAEKVPVFPTRPSIRDAGTLVIHDHSSAEGFYINPSTSIETKVQLQDNTVRDAVMLVQHDNPQSLEKEGLSLAAATSEAEFKIDEENQKSQEMGIITRSLSRKSIVAEESQHSCVNMEANATIQGCTGGPETYNEFQSENKTLEGFEIINNFPNTHLEDAQMQLDSSLTPQNVDHSDIFEEQPELSDNGMKLEKDLLTNHQLLPTTDSVRQECVCKGVMNVVDQSDVYECDRKPSNTIVHSPPAGQAVGLHCNNNGQLCVAYGTSGSTGMDSISEHNENYSDRRYTYNTECSDLVLLSELKSSSNDEMEGVNTCVEYCSAEEESCSFLRKVADSMLEEEPTLFGEFGQVAADNKQVYMNESLSPEKNANLDKAKNSVDIVSHGCDCDLQNSNAGALSPTVQGNASDLYGEDQPNQSQGFDGIMPLQGTYDYVINERSGYGLESCGQAQDPSECSSNFPVSQRPTTSGNFTSTAFCSVTDESCSVSGGDKSLQTSTYKIGAEGSKISFEEEAETEASQEGKHPMVGEFHHELDGGSDLKHNKDATAVSTKRSNGIKKQDNSLVIHPPNAVPFSDEWLAIIEAAGEEILTMKRGAVQHSPPDKSLPEPSPWSPVKKKGNQIGPYDCTKYTNGMPSNPH